ncbi:ABC transporter permease [Mucilaginibacter myungsuensis]|uniref:ABC transporter permease n=1 Tax=Mucilaginibacter myungsuensis TaxID=649104 RepID=A0A929PVR9_9SPHI|nr:ABC transporter permease [Mucilaginibacter myungsuensis]MBE9660605.1 ABC transporter permease [Mucilaginibacter myungsuensis]MDN3600650.1 ABC transporter permease [Mucilaginibacter myungsuensis]
MLKNYIKIAWRNLWKNKVFSGINIVGLSVGMAACIIIMLFVKYEKSFDEFHTKNIYRLNEVQKFPGMNASQKVGLSMYPMGPTIKADFPEIKNFTRVNWKEKYQTTYQDKRVFLPQVFFVDSTFLKIFDFKLISGDPNTALEKPNTAIVTAETAKKLFGDADPMGKTITHYGGDTTLFTITGVMQNVPKNSQLQFDGLFNFRTIYQSWMGSWSGNWLDTYFEIDPKADIAALEKKFPAYLKKRMPNPENVKYYELFLLPLKDIHANAGDIGLDYLNFQKFDAKSTNLFAIIAIIVLVIACINFMNLSTARSAERAKEVGIRKSIGARRFQLSMQFLGETVLLSLIALVVALILVALALPYVNNLSQRELGGPLYHSVGFILAIIGGAMFVGLLSGIYPAVFLSSYKPVKVLKGSVETGKNKGNFRNVLVVGQFASAVFLMIATIFVVKQLRFMQQKDPGFDREQIVTIPLSGQVQKNYEAFKQRLLGNAMIQGVTGAQDQLGSHLDQSGVDFKYNSEPLKNLAVTRLIVDDNYLDVYKIKMAEGKNFSRNKASIGKEYIVNESLAKMLLKDYPNAKQSSLIGQYFGFDSVGTIVGIVKDFNFNSLHHKVETMFLSNHADWGISQVSVKINAGKAAEALAFIKVTWDNINPDFPFEYQFLDDHFNEVYRADTQVSKIVGILAGLAILISCLGLFGLASYSAEKRVKEIGVRKVLGASVQNIVVLLSTHFVKLVLVANLLAWPIAWYAMNKWLGRFAYRIDINWFTFVLVAMLSVSIALLTISFQAIKAAITNPVKSLRSE